MYFWLKVKKNKWCLRRSTENQLEDGSNLVSDSTFLLVYYQPCLVNCKKITLKKFNYLCVMSYIFLRFTINCRSPGKFPHQPMKRQYYIRVYIEDRCFDPLFVLKQDQIPKQDYCDKDRYAHYLSFAISVHYEACLG